MQNSIQQQQKIYQNITYWTSTRPKFRDRQKCEEKKNSTHNTHTYTQQYTLNIASVKTDVSHPDDFVQYIALDRTIFIFSSAIK